MQYPVVMFTNTSYFAWRKIKKGLNRCSFILKWEIMKRDNSIDLSKAKESQVQRKDIPIDQIKPPVYSNIPEVEREGVFEHRFKCMDCRLEFKVYSWQEFKHRADNVFCPECGTKGNKVHFPVKTLSTKKDFDLFDGNEIFNHMG